MGVTDRVRAKERWQTLFLRRLLKTDRSGNMGLVSDITHGPMYGLAVGSYDNFNFGRK